MFQKRYFNLTNEKDVQEIHRILYNSNSTGPQSDEEVEDQIIPDLRRDDESSEKEISQPISQSHVQTPALSSSDSEEDIPLSSLQSTDSVKVKIVEVPLLNMHI
ncbi:hypothetical protein Trydic_g17925 [Trypoxylus dichotomus]